MMRISKNPNALKRPQRGKESKRDQHGTERKGVLKCPYCGNVRFEKEWHTSIATLRSKRKDKNLKVTQEEVCSACTMIRGGLFEGELFVESFPLKHKNELLRLIKNFGNRDTEMDPQNRIIAIEKVDGELRIITTENQLANRLAKKIKDVFNKVEVSISFSKEPYKVNRVRAIFISEEDKNI